MCLQVEVQLQEIEEDFLKSQQEEQDKFDENLADLANTVSTFSAYNDLKLIEEIYENAMSVNVELKKAQEQAKLFNSRETLFGKDRKRLKIGAAAFAQRAFATCQEVSSQES